MMMLTIVEGGFDYILGIVGRKGFIHKCGDKLPPNVLYGYPWVRFIELTCLIGIQFLNIIGLKIQSAFIFLYPLAKKSHDCFLLCMNIQLIQRDYR